MRNTRWIILVDVLLLWSGSPLPVQAQGLGASSDVGGRVTDPGGTAVPDATVALVDVARGITRKGTTGADGEYRFTAVPPTTYDLRAEHPGFETQVQKDVVLTVGQKVTIDFALKLSTLHTEVVVAGRAPLIETEKVQQADTIGENYIRQLPIDRRDYLSFTLLAPGVADSNAFADNTDFRVAQTPQSGLSFYGSNGRGNNAQVDGSEANDDSGGVRRTLSQEAVQEFQINRSNYSAEFGGASGGVINIVSKSGTNDLHGSAYGFFRDDAFDARDPFAIAPPTLSVTDFALNRKGTPVKPSSNRQQFGGTAGFPLRKDKTFAFIAYEHLRRDESAAVSVLTDSSIFAPTAEQSPIMAGLMARGTAPVPCFGIPPNATVLPAVACAASLQRLLTVNASLAPDTPLSAKSEPYLVNLFTQNSGIFPFTGRNDEFSVRLDHRANERNQLFLRYNFTNAPERNTNLRALVGFSRGNIFDGFDSTTALGWYHQFSARSQNEARAQWNYNALDVSPNDTLGPGINIAGFGFFNRDIFLPSFTTLRRYEFADNLTLVRGAHKMKLGGYLLLRGNKSESHTFFPGRFNFGDLPGGVLSPCLAAPNACGLPGLSAAPVSALQAAKLGLPQFYQQGFGDPDVSSLLPLTAFYWQDSWALRSNLNLSFGMRYELDKRRAPLPTDKNNFAPRFGFSWDPFHDKKTVVRGGYGIYYSPVYYQIDDVVQSLGVVNGFRQIPQVFASFNTLAPCAPQGVLTPTARLSACVFQTLLSQGVIGCSTTTEACIAPANLTQFGINITQTGPIPPLSVIFSGSDDYQNPYSQQASFGIERQLAPDLSVSVDYIYAYTLKIPRARDKNLLRPPGNGPLGIPQWTVPNPCPTLAACFVNPAILQDNVYESTARAFYHGFILTVNKRFGHHLTLLGNYTYSKAIDEVTDYNSDFEANDQTNLRAERALSAFDQRHKLVIAGVLESPWQGGSGASAFVRVFSGFLLSPLLRGNSGRPFNLLTGSDTSGDRHSTTHRPPFAGRNAGLGPDFWTFDLRLTRRIGLGERRNLELIAESFNLFNRLNIASINNTVGVIPPPFNLTGRKDRSPSQPLGFTSAFDPRRIQLGVRFNF